MADPLITVWPEPSRRRKVMKATVNVVKESEGLYQVAFQDSANKQLGVQLPKTALRSLVEEGAALLALSK